MHGRSGKQGVKVQANCVTRSRSTPAKLAVFSPLQSLPYVSSMLSEWLPDTFNLIACCRHTFQAFKPPSWSEPILQQRRRTRVCIFSIKLGATNPTLSTARESSKPRPPGGAVVKFPLATETQSGRAVPSCQLCGPLPRSAETAGASGGGKCPEPSSASGGVRESPHTELPPEASLGFTMPGRSA